MLLHIFRHIQTADCLIVIKQKVGKRLRQFRLTHTRGPKEHEGPDGSSRVLQPGARPAYCTRNRTHSFGLPDNARGKSCLHLKQFFPFAFQHLVHGNTGPPRNNLRDMGCAHGFLNHSAIIIRLFSQLLLKAGNHAIRKFTGSLQIAASLRLHQFVTCRVEFFLNLLRTTELLLVALPNRRHRRRL